MANFCIGVSRHLIILLLTLFASGSIGYAQSSPTVSIQYVRPQTFTDFRIYDRDANWSADYFTQQIGPYLGSQLQRNLPGYTLSLSFTDIDLAGTVRSTRQANNVRVVRNNRPIRLSFDYTLRSPTGKVAASGPVRLTDTPRLSTRSGGSDVLSDEKRLLVRWLNSIKVPS